MGDKERAEVDRRTQANCLLTLTVIAVGGSLYLLRPVLVPFALALFLTCCLVPLIEAQRRWLGLPRWLATVGAALLGLVVLVAFAFLATAAVGAIGKNFDTYRDRLHRLADEVGQLLPPNELGVGLDAATGLRLLLPEGTQGGLLSALLSASFDALTTATLVLLFMVFLLIGRATAPARKGSLLAAIEERITYYILQIVLFSALTGVLVGGTLAFLGVEFALVFGFLTFLLNFIPNVGAIIATLLPLPVVLLSPELSPTVKVCAFLIPGAIQVTLGTIVQPRVQGCALDLHPVIVLLALLFFGTIWGGVGTLLAMPTTAAIKMFTETSPSTLPLARLLAGDFGALLGDKKTAEPGNGDPAPG